ncbi:hypothetical protein NDN08_004327 [Rhodosorus marinus]|uniref:MAGE domain-containing protein n=1 Tax=Rhodosorus marinus TaxID=101924 RepID=A0AAV8UQ12_9RHOD|nr:hypothetical protein NDN08_004327 [Rhodosorus marinus]
MDDTEGYDVEDSYAPGGPSQLGTAPTAEKEKLAGKVVRFLLARHLQNVLTSRTDISKLFDEAIRSRRTVIGEVFKLAQTYLLERFGMEVVEVYRKVKGRSTTGLSQTARSVLSQASASQGTGQAKYYILVSALPQERRPPVQNKAVLGLVSTIASLILLNPHFRVNENSLVRHLEELGVESEGRNLHHPQLGNVSQLLEVELIKQGYFEKEKDGDQSFYSFGPRLRGEIGTEALVEMIDQIFDGELDDVTKQELKLRADGVQEPVEA